MVCVRNRVSVWGVHIYLVYHLFTRNGAKSTLIGRVLVVATDSPATYSLWKKNYICKYFSRRHSQNNTKGELNHLKWQECIRGINKVRRKHWALFLPHPLRQEGFVSDSVGSDAPEVVQGKPIEFPPNRMFDSERTDDAHPDLFRRWALPGSSFTSKGSCHHLMETFCCLLGIGLLFFIQ